MRHRLPSLLTAALALIAGAAVVSAALMLFAALTIHEAVSVLLELTARSLEESP